MVANVLGDVLQRFFMQVWRSKNGVGRGLAVCLRLAVDEGLCLCTVHAELADRTRPLSWANRWFSFGSGGGESLEHCPRGCCCADAHYARHIAAHCVPGRLHRVARTAFYHRVATSAEMQRLNRSLATSTIGRAMRWISVEDIAAMRIMACTKFGPSRRRKIGRQRIRWKDPLSPTGSLPRTL